jgi:hypothetical protein
MHPKYYKMKYIPILIFVLTITVVHGKQTYPELITSSGADYINQNIQLSWSIGEIISETYDQSGKQLTQGFQQTDKATQTGLEKHPNLENQILAYPNPAKGKIYLRTDQSLYKYQYRIFDALGKLVYSGEIITTDNTIDIIHIPSGMYFMKIYSKERNLISTLKLQIIN